jgi:hypothetical protein
MFDGDLAANRPHLSGLIDVEALRRAENSGAQDGSGTAPQQYEENRSGQKEDQSGAGRPLVGGQSGPRRAAEIAGSSSVSRVSENQIRENALPGPDAKDAAV